MDDPTFPAPLPDDEIHRRLLASGLPSNLFPSDGPPGPGAAPAPAPVAPPTPTIPGTSSGASAIPSAPVAQPSYAPPVAKVLSFAAPDLSGTTNDFGAVAPAPKPALTTGPQPQQGFGVPSLSGDGSGTPAAPQASAGPGQPREQERQHGAVEDTGKGAGSDPMAMNNDPLYTAAVEHWLKEHIAGYKEVHGRAPSTIHITGDLFLALAGCASLSCTEDQLDEEGEITYEGGFSFEGIELTMSATDDRPLAIVSPIDPPEDAPLMFIPTTAEKAQERLREHIQAYFYEHLQTPTVVALPWEVFVLLLDAEYIMIFEEAFIFEGVILRPEEMDSSLLYSPI